MFILSALALCAKPAAEVTVRQCWTPPSLTDCRTGEACAKIQANHQALLQATCPHARDVEAVLRPFASASACNNRYGETRTEMVNIRRHRHSLRPHS